MTKADLQNNELDAVRAWQRLMTGEHGETRLAELGINLNHYAEWIPGGEFGYHYAIDGAGTRNYVWGDL